jgi:predicted metal-dependent hydrolase
MLNPAFNYRVRVSPRGRNVRLRVTVRNGLEVVIPRGFDPEKVPGILERKKNWVRSALERADAHKKFFEPQPSWKVPTEIQLAALGNTWHVISRSTDANKVTVRELREQVLLVVGAIEDESRCREALARWLMRKTREQLMPRLEALSARTRLRFKRIFIKRPTTRWASCSRGKSISLNAKLLFLPPKTVDYVLIHELCHLVEMNHSTKFWALVETHCPEFRMLDANLREMWKIVPRWAHSTRKELSKHQTSN